MRTAMAARLRSEGDRRPSVECVFHALIPSRFVIHTHPTLVNSLTCARGRRGDRPGPVRGRRALGAVRGPGLPLAREIARLRGEHAARTGARRPRRHAPPEPRAHRGRGRPGRDRRPLVRARRRAAAATWRAGRQPRTTPPSSADPATVDRLARVLARRLATGAEPLAVAFDGSRGRRVARRDAGGRGRWPGAAR